VKLITCSAASIVHISVTTSRVNFAGACKWAFSSQSTNFMASLVFHQAFTNHCVSFPEIDNAPKNAAVCIFSLATGFKFKLSKEVQFTAE
jgi:hypothetical protein